MTGRSSQLLRALATGAVSTALALLLPAALLGATVDFFAYDGGGEAFLSEMAIHPTALRIGTVTYIAYQGPGYDPYVASFDESSGTWDGPYRAGENPLLRDAHGSPSLFTDPEGRLHVLYGSHNSRLYHGRTLAPGDISQWEALEPVDTGKTTYPQTFKRSDGRVVLFYRELDGFRDWVMRIAEEDCESFGEKEIVLKGSPDTWWYADFRPGEGDVVHAAFVWQNQEEYSSGLRYCRRNVYYMRRDPDGAWRSLEGTVVPIPLEKDEANRLVRVVDSGEDLCNEISVKEGPDGEPRILFLQGNGAGPDRYAWRFLRSQDDTFTASTIATTDHFFDSGAFSFGSEDSLEALLVNGESGAEGGANGNARGRGGRIDRFVSADGGSTWTREERVSPDETATPFADPQYVSGGDGSGPARAAFIEWTNDVSNFFNRIYLWGDEGLVSRELESGSVRLGGVDRDRTAIEVSRESFPAGSTHVVIATRDDYPDALAGIPLAHAVGAPLLLSARSGLSDETVAEIVRLGATRAILLGGTDAIGPEIYSQLPYPQTAVRNIERLAGADRYSTAAAVARRLVRVDPTRLIDSAYMVSGEKWPDATVAAPLAATAGVPVLLTRRDGLPESTASLLAEIEATSTVVVGGAAAVSDEVVASLPSPTRLAGADRYETALVAAEYGLVRTLNPHRLIVATGQRFPDALTGGGLAARMRSPVLLTRSRSLSEPLRAYLDARSDSIVRLYILGERAAVSEEVEAELGVLIDRGF